MTESKKHKAKRIVVFAFLGFLVAILGVAAAAGTTQAAAGVQHHSTVLQSESVIIEDWGHNPVNGTYQELPISSTNGTTTVFNDFTVTHKSGNTTNVTTDYYAPPLPSFSLFSHQPCFFTSSYCFSYSSCGYPGPCGTSVPFLR